jgi:hypothetical protein
MRSSPFLPHFRENTVSSTQIVFAAFLIVVLLGLAAYYAWRQVQALRGLRGQENLPREDRLYVRNQAWRRLACSGLMVVFAGILAGSFFIEGPAEELADQRAAARERGEPEDPGQQWFAKFYGYYWTVALLVLLAMVLLALYDLVAIRRFGARHFRQLQADRRAMIERQAARLREERDGHP